MKKNTWHYKLVRESCTHDESDPTSYLSYWGKVLIGVGWIIFAATPVLNVGLLGILPFITDDIPLKVIGSLIYLVAGALLISFSEELGEQFPVKWRLNREIFKLPLIVYEEEDGKKTKKFEEPQVDNWLL